ncbi:MAG: glycoside hydrolase family 127 protein [Phycisphaeraceae bacterium]|nr:glycoside hydrolase family 127 protein [Phycisphaeraceae bacterium]
MNTLTTTCCELQGELGRRLRAIWHDNLRVLNWEQDFLKPFREKTSGASFYVGLGKTLTGLVYAARHFGGEADTLRQRIVSETLKTQDADGYIGCYGEADRGHRCWDAHEQAYIIQALLDNAMVFGDQASLDGAMKLGRWLMSRLKNQQWRKVNEGYLWVQLCLTGVDRAMLRLGRQTGEPAFLDFLEHDLNVPGWFDPIVEGRQGGVAGHAYAYLSHCLAQMEMQPAGAPIPPATQAVIGYLRAGGGLVISGNCGHTECWHSDQRIDGKLGETCTAAYLIRWAFHLLGRTHDGWFGDLIERAMYNALFAANSRDGRRIRYYSAAEGPRTWHPNDTYCCPGNYRRILGELPDHILRPHGEGVAIDLYESCRAATTLAGGRKLELRLTTEYPMDGRIVVELSPQQPGQQPGEFPVDLRIPGWAAGHAIQVNGQPVSCPVHQGYASILRPWRAGDRIELMLDMPWRLVRGFRKQQQRVAVMRGPVVWGADPADHPGLEEQLHHAMPDVRTCVLSSGERRAEVRGKLKDQTVELHLIPFADMNTAVTYFDGQPNQGDEPDHLLWLAPDPIGVGAAPEA